MLFKSLLSSLSRKEILGPIFILGSGRSGTTVLGTALSKHNMITYLNERRDLWFDAYPETDIWTDKAICRYGKICLTVDDSDAVKSLKLRRLFHKETVKTSKPILVEKLPINNFRVDFIRSIFPDAKFIHIYRNGLEVARSIQKLSEEKHWFGSNGYKWEQLRAYSKQSDITVELPELCDNNYLKGLLEWRLGTESVVNSLINMSEDKFIEISYSEFTKKPAETIRKVLSFIGIDEDSSVVRFVNKNISRKTKTLDNNNLSDQEYRIGGKLLPLSINDTIKGLTIACSR